MYTQTFDDSDCSQHPPDPMMHGADTPKSELHKSPPARMMSEQHIDPSSPGMMDSHPAPPHCPQSTEQHTTPCWKPTIPLEHSDKSPCCSVIANDESGNVKVLSFELEYRCDINHIYVVLHPLGNATRNLHDVPEGEGVPTGNMVGEGDISTSWSSAGDGAGVVGPVASRTVGAREPTTVGLGESDTVASDGAGVPSRVGGNVPSLPIVGTGVVAMMQGASAPFSPHIMPEDSMATSQQSLDPLVPGILLHPEPPHCPQASAQQISPCPTPGIPFEHVDDSGPTYANTMHDSDRHARVPFTKPRST